MRQNTYHTCIHRVFGGDRCPEWLWYVYEWGQLGRRGQTDTDESDKVTLLRTQMSDWQGLGSKTG